MRFPSRGSQPEACGCWLTAQRVGNGSSEEQAFNALLESGGAGIPHPFSKNGEAMLLPYERRAYPDAGLWFNGKGEVVSFNAFLQRMGLGSLPVKSCSSDYART